MLKQLNRKLKNNRGYVLILVAFALPVIFLGVNYLLKSESVSHKDTIRTNAAAAVGTAVLEAYNPALTWSAQKDFVYSAGAQALNDKGYSLSNKMLIPASSENSTSSIYINDASSSVSNLARVYVALHHSEKIYSNSPLYNVDVYPINNVVFDPDKQKVSFNLSSTESGGGEATYRLSYPESSDNLSLKLDVQNDAIICNCPSIYRKATVYPAKCNVDIIIAIPTNYATCTKNNLNTDTLISSSSNEAASTPIKIIATIIENGLKNCLKSVQGPAIAVIPYSAKVSVAPNWGNNSVKSNEESNSVISNGKSEWTTFIPSLNESAGEPRLSQSQVYASNGQEGGTIFNNTYMWGNYTVTDFINNSTEDISNFGIMGRYGDDGKGTGVEILSTENPGKAEKFKFRRMNLNPCYLGYCNLLADACETTCTTFQPNPFFIQELTDNVFGVAYDLSIFQPINDQHNKSNFLFLPLLWACNLLSDWAAHPESNTTTEKMAHPKRNSKKKAVILVVNAPNHFEPGELTYLGFNNDAAELPMSESDVINFSNPIKGSGGTIQGTKGIITYSGAGYYDSENNEFVCDGTGTLAFPKKGLVKIVVAKASQTFKGQNSGRHEFTSEQTFTFDGPVLPNNNIYGYGTVYNSTQGQNFGGNLSANKVKYKLENAKITACNLYGQVLRDYVGQYGREQSTIRPLILNDGTKAKRSGNNAYTVYQTYNITSSGRINAISGLKTAVQKFMDPCMTISNNPDYSNGTGRGEYTDDVTYEIYGTGRGEHKDNDEIYGSKIPLICYCSINANPRTIFWTSHKNNLTVAYDTTYICKVESTENRPDYYLWRVADNFQINDESTEDGNVPHLHFIRFETDKDKKKLGMYILNGNSLNSLSKTLPTSSNVDTDIKKNACVYLTGNWTCFNGDGKLEVKVEPEGEKGAITFYDDNRVDEIPAAISFSDISSNSTYGAQGATKYDITEQKTFYIEPSQIAANNTITLNMDGIALISAEITNREYTIYESSVSVNGGAVTTTYVPAPFVITVAPVQESSCTITDKSSGVKRPHRITAGGTTTIDLDYFTKYATNEELPNTDNLPSSWSHAPYEKFSYSCTDAKVTQYTISDRMIRWDGGTHTEKQSGSLYLFPDSTDSVISYWGPKIHEEKDHIYITQKKDFWHVWGDKLYVTWSWNESLPGTVYIRFRSDGGLQNGYYTYAQIDFNGKKSKVYESQSNAIIVSIKNEGSTCTFQHIGDVQCTGKHYLYWMVFKPNNTSKIVNSASGNVDFAGTGRVKLTVTSDLPTPTITIPWKNKDIPRTLSITESKDITINPEDCEFTQIRSNNNDSHFDYTVQLGLNGVRITGWRLQQQTTGLWYHKISPPSHCAYVDYSINDNGGPKMIDIVPGYYWKPKIWWDDSVGYWKPSDSQSDNNGIYNNIFSQTKLDGFEIIDDPAMHKYYINNSKFYAGGLLRWFEDSSLINQEYFRCDIEENANINSPSFVYAGYVLRVNAQLYNYEISKNRKYNDPKTALDNLAKEACTKLKGQIGENGKIYLIKYQTDDSTLDGDVHQVYSVSNAGELEEILNKIVADIKATAGYEESRIIVEETQKSPDKKKNN